MKEDKIRVIVGKDYVSDDVEVWMKTVDVSEWTHIIHSDKVYDDDTYVIKYKEKS